MQLCDNCKYEKHKDMYGELVKILNSSIPEEERTFKEYIVRPPQFSGDLFQMGLATVAFRYVDPSDGCLYLNFRYIEVNSLIENRYKFLPQIFEFAHLIVKNKRFKINKYGDEEQVKEEARMWIWN